MEVEEYLQHLRVQFDRMNEEEREAMLVEVRDYLEQESERLRNLSPGRPKADALAQAMVEFGDPADLSVTYDASLEVLAIINQRTGETLLEMPEFSGGAPQLPARGRGVRVMVKYRGATGLGLIGIAVLLLLVLPSGTPPGEVQSDAALFQFTDLGVANANHEAEEQFHLAQAGRVMVDVVASEGCVTIQLVDSEGAAAFDQTMCSDADGHALEANLEPGDWTLHIQYEAFTGDVRITVS